MLKPALATLKQHGSEGRTSHKTPPKKTLTCLLTSVDLLLLLLLLLFLWQLLSYFFPLRVPFCAAVVGGYWDMGPSSQMPTMTRYYYIFHHISTYMLFLTNLAQLCTPGSIWRGGANTCSNDSKFRNVVVRTILVIQRLCFPWPNGSAWNA